jgi:hypothetical protein
MVHGNGALFIGPQSPVIRQSRREMGHIHSILFIGDPFVRGSHVPNARVYSRSFPLSDTEGNWATLLVEADWAAGAGNRPAGAGNRAAGAGTRIVRAAAVTGGNSWSSSSSTFDPYMVARLTTVTSLCVIKSFSLLRGPPVMASSLSYLVQYMWNIATVARTRPRIFAEIAGSFSLILCDMCAKITSNYLI